MSTKKIGIGGYLLAVIVILLGVAGAAGILINSFQTWDEGVVRVAIPGEHELELKESGSYTIYHEYRSERGGVVFSNLEGVSGLQCTLLDEHGGQVEMDTPLGTQTYSLGAYSGQAIFTFEVGEPGTYRLDANYPEISTSKPRAMLAIGQGIVGRILFAVFGSLGVGVGAFGLATIIFVITLIRRMKMKKEVTS